MITKRYLTKSLALAAIALSSVATQPAFAWEPSKPVTFVVPAGTGLRPQQRTVDVHRVIRQPDHGEIAQVVGDHHIGAAGEHQYRPVTRPIQRGQRRHDLLGGGAGDQAAGDRADPQGGQRRQRHPVRHRRTTEVITSGSHAR